LSGGADPDKSLPDWSVTAWPAVEKGIFHKKGLKGSTFLKEGTKRISQVIGKQAVHKNGKGGFVSLDVLEEDANDSVILRNQNGTGEPESSSRSTSDMTQQTTTIDN